MYSLPQSYNQTSKCKRCISSNAYFRHEHVNITIQWITVVSTSDYLAYTLSLASHIVKLRKVVEVVKTVDTQHKPSSFPTSVFSP